MTVQLYDYWRSSASYRVRIALNLAGIEAEHISVDLTTGAQRDALHLARNPQGFVPVLQIDGLRLTQSLAIVEYLNETRGLGLLPPDAAGRAAVRALAHAIAMDLHPVCNLSVARRAVADSGGAISIEGWMRAFIGPRLADFAAMLEGGTHCHGDAITLADLCLVPQIYNARRWGAEVPQPLCDIADRLEAIPAFAAAAPRQP